MTELEKAAVNLRNAALATNEGAGHAARDRSLRLAAVEYVRELSCSMLGYAHSDRQLDEYFDELAGRIS